MTFNRWLPNFAPATTITIAAFIAIGLAISSVLLALEGP